MLTAVASFAYTNYTKHNNLCKIKSVTFYFHTKKNLLNTENIQNLQIILQ